MALSRIFVGASLPNDHPDSIPLRKQDSEPLDELIIKSPPFVQKIKRRLSRKSLIPFRSLQCIRSKCPQFFVRSPPVFVNSNSVEDIAEILINAAEEYDSDAHSVKIHDISSQTSRAPRVITPATNLPRPNIQNFDWLAPEIER